MARSTLFLAPVATLAIALGLLFVFFPSASAGSRDGLTVLAQVQQQSAPTGLAAPGKGKRVACNGKTSTQCCVGTQLLYLSLFANGRSQSDRLFRRHKA